MIRGTPANRSREATFADLELLGDEVSAEIIRGAIVEKASPTMAHGRSQLMTGRVLSQRVDRRPGGRWPGGWSSGTEVDVEYETHELYRHDLAAGGGSELRPVRRAVRSASARTGCARCCRRPTKSAI
jgi:hypothetical protein